MTELQECRREFIFFGHETFAHGATCFAIRYEERKGDTSQEHQQARHHPRRDKRVIRSLSDEESVDQTANGHKMQREKIMV